MNRLCPSLIKFPTPLSAITRSYPPNKIIRISAKLNKVILAVRSLHLLRYSALVLKYESRHGGSDGGLERR